MWPCMQQVFDAAAMLLNEASSISCVQQPQLANNTHDCESAAKPCKHRCIWYAICLLCTADMQALFVVPGQRRSLWWRLHERVLALSLLHLLLQLDLQPMTVSRLLTGNGGVHRRGLTDINTEHGVHSC